jgi:cobalamin biosynthesis Mg chelatase CobN
VLALLALVCFVPVAQAEEASGIEYRDATPSATGSAIPTHHSNPPAKASDAGGGKSGSSNSGAPGGESSTEHSGVGGGSEAGNGGGTGQGSPGKAQDGSGKGSATPKASTGAQPGGHPSSSADDGGSSPLVPILIAIAVLAAISIGFVAMRRRRPPTGSGSTRVSSEPS